MPVLLIKSCFHNVTLFDKCFFFIYLFIIPAKVRNRSYSYKDIFDYALLQEKNKKIIIKK